MAWDKDNPPGTTKVRNADDLIRENNIALETALSEGHEFTTGGNQTGKHTTPTFKDNGGDPSQPTATNETVFYNSGGRLYSLNQAGTKRNVDKNTDIPAGTKMLFKQSSAPAGWTFLSEDNDKVLLNTSTEADGGALGGDWTLSGVSVDGHALTESELPNISGSFDIRPDTNSDRLVRNTSGNFSFNTDVGGGYNDLKTEAADSSLDRVTFSFGSGNAHTHPSLSNSGWRPSYAKVITCSKD